jgi:hypothetical protein
MDRRADAELERFRTIEDNIAIVRTILAILPLWLLGEVLIWLSPANVWGYGTVVLAFTALLLILSIVRVVVTSRVNDPEHRFFNGARKIAMFMDRERKGRTVALRRPSELLKLKIVNLALQPIGWAILLAFFLGGYRSVMDGLSNGQPWPLYSGLIYKWAMPAMVVIFSIQAIAGGIRTIKSKDVTDFPMTRALLRTDEPK